MTNGKTNPTHLVDAVQPLVSVAMITYNHRPYIEQAVNSILHQQADFGVELVIGEDCSKDGTRDFVLQMQRQHPERIRVIATEHNVGAHQNMHRTELACRGKYVAFCEGDDYWQDPAKLAKQVAFLEARPDYSMVHSHCHRYVVAEKKLLRNSLTVPTGLDDARAYEDLLLGVRYALTVTVVTRREQLNWILEHCPECTDPKWPMGDTQSWLELSRLGKVGCIHESLATTNILPESAGQSQDVRKRLRFQLAARELQLHYLQKYPVAVEVDRAVRRHLARSVLGAAYAACDGAVAADLFQDFIRNGGRPDSAVHCLRWGSYSRARHRLVYPYLKVEARWRRWRRSRAVA